MVSYLLRKAKSKLNKTLNYSIKQQMDGCYLRGVL